MQYGNGPTYGGSTMTPAMSLAISIYDSVSSQFLEVKYAEFLWRKVLSKDQIIGDVNVGAQNFVKIIRDQRGMAAFQSQTSNQNIPRVGLSLGAMTIPLQASAVSSAITNEDERQYKAGNLGTLTKDLGGVMNKACENLIETTTIFGDPSVGFQGFMSYTGIPTSNPAMGASQATEWTSKTAQEMVKDVNDAITYMWVNSRGIFIPGKVFLPMQQYSYLANTPMTIGGVNNGKSAMTYLMENNIYTNETGKQLEIIVFRYLTKAGAANSDRMILMDSNPDYQGMPFPLPYAMTAPVPVPLGAAFFAEQKHGSFSVFQPGSMLYIDGI